MRPPVPARAALPTAHRRPRGLYTYRGVLHSTQRGPRWPNEDHPAHDLQFSRLALRWEPALLTQAEEDVCVLQRLSRRPLHEIVDGRDDNESWLPQIGGFRNAHPNHIASDHVS